MEINYLGQTMKFSDRNILWTLVVIQAVFGILTINGFPISLDEPYSIYHSQQRLPALLGEVSSGNNAPLHFLLLHFWIKLFGISAFAVRSLSLIAAMLTTGILYRFSRKFLGQQFAILMVGLFIFSRLNHFVAIEARMYGLFTMFFVLILFELYRFLFEGKTNWLGLALWNVGLLYSHYLGGVIVFMEFALILFFWQKMTPDKWKTVLYTFLVGLVLVLPGLYMLFDRAISFSKDGSWVSDAQWLDLWTNLVKLFNNQLTFIGTLLLAISALIIIKIRKLELNQGIVRFWGVWSVGSYIVLFIISILFSSVFFIKYLQFLTIPFYALIVYLFYAAFKELGGFLKYASVLPMVLFIASVKFIPDVNRETDKLVQYVLESKGNGVSVYYCPPHYDYTLAYHIDQDLFRKSLSIRADLALRNFISVYNADDIKTDDQSLIYIDFDADLLYPNNGVLEKLDREMNFESVQSFMGDFNVYFYGK